MEDKPKAIFKFNGGQGALLCSKCHTILKVGYQFTQPEADAMRGYITLPPQTCETLGYACKMQKDGHGKR